MDCTVPMAAPMLEGRPAFDTKADSVEVELDQTARGTSMDEIAPPSAEELVQRAHAMGPARMTWESIVLPSDPVLSEKRTAHVAERRARLTRVVKVTLAACLGVCVLALGVSALSGDSSSSASKSAAEASLGKSVPSKSVVPVEPMDGTKHGKAVRRVAPAATTAAAISRPTKRR